MSMDDEIAASGKAIFMLHADDDALAFWSEPAKAKIVTVYMQGCGWCHKFVPEYIKLAPHVANSDLLFGSASRDHLSKVTKFIPALQVRGFPTTLLVDSTNQVREVVPGYRPAHEWVDIIEKQFPELRGLATLQYLQVMKREALAQLEKARQAMRSGGNGGNGGNNGQPQQPSQPRPMPVPTQVPVLHPTLRPPTALAMAPAVAPAMAPAMPHRAGGFAPPDVVTGSGTAGDHALPPHLRTHPIPAHVQSASHAQPRVVTATAPPPAPPVASVQVRQDGGARQQRAHSVQQHQKGAAKSHKHANKGRSKTGGQHAPQDPQPNNSNSNSGWCTIL